jgi:hypothetical protein
MNDEMEFHIPDSEEFRRGYELFNEKGKQGIDNIWFEALSIVQDNWGNPTDMTRGISRLIRSWNRFFANFDLETMSACIVRNQATLNEFRNRDIASLSETDTSAITNLFNDFLISLQRKSDNRKSPVSVAKALSLIAPNFFPIWDSNIAFAYGCSYFSDSADDPYIKFSHKMKLLAGRVRDFVPIQDERPLLKRIDEYNFSKYTAHWI